MTPETGSPDFIDVNILPEQHQPRKLPRRAIILSLIAISLAALILPLYLVSASVRGDIVSLETEFQSVQDALATVDTPVAEVQELMNTLSQVQESGGELEEAHSTIVADQADWSAVMAAIGNYDPDQLALNSLAQANNRITLNGHAINRPAVVAYADGLKASDLFASVEVQSITAVETPLPATSTPEVTLAPGVTITPGVTIAPTETITPGVTITPTATVIPVGPDEYEIDDFQARDIILGQTQRHNFYPVYDVDKVKFLAKAGRYYRIYTSDLVPAVDTFLEVNAGGNIHTNDDCNPGSGDLSSCLVFQVNTGYDVDATIKISNRGQFGPEMWYQVTVDEISATPTPIPTDTPIPTNTPVPPTMPPPTETLTPTVTHTPTETPTPTPTPTSTPDLRDVYEPDDTDPQPIAVEETQAHNFFPDSDIDKVTFGVKEGRLYALTTSNLTMGTDTKIVVKINGEPCLTCVNDDVGPGFLESSVRFIPEANGTAEATISVGPSGQYGDDKTYDLTLTLLSTVVDEYEPDDPFAKPIAVEGVQEHNFYPEGDQDLVKFLAKALRHYAVFTSDLAEGVDTKLKVTLGPHKWENDDRSPGTGNFDSEVCFQAPIEDTAVVLITNRQHYDLDKTYEIAVSEAPVLAVNPLGLSFTAVEGGDNPAPQEVNIFNLGGGVLTWVAEEYVTWLNIAPSSGAAPSTMSVSVDTTLLMAGTYTGQIIIDGSSSRCCAAPCWQTVTVVLQIIPPTPTPEPTDTPEPTPTESASLWPPGLASLGSPGLAGSPYRLQTTRGDRVASGLLSPEAVEFVIVLELKTGPP